MATNTYVALDKVTVGTATPSVTFSAIGAGYTDLVIVFECFTTAAGARDVALRFNGDTASNYSSTFLYGTGSVAGSTRESNQTRMMIDYSGAGTTSSTAEIGIVNIMNYSNATTNKTVLVRANRAGAGTDAVVGLWRNTAAITSVTLMFINGTDNFGVGSVFSLYGILAEGGAKATGGYVTSDANYYYHTFLASGTFTPKSTLSCDVLVIAGAGGGGGYMGGGGGAGGVSYQTSRSVSTATTVTVGGGGAGNSNARGSSGTNSVFDTITSNGGGGGGAGQPSIFSGVNGGSGGGATVYDSPSAAGTGGTATQGNTGGATGYGNKAGDAYMPGYWGTGGGGAGAASANATSSTSSAGGAGLNTWSDWATATSTGASGYYAGGGGAGDNSTGTVGGAGGGGRGSTGTKNPVAGTTNTGSGGGGTSGGTSAGAAGGSGIVIVRYAKV